MISHALHFCLYNTGMRKLKLSFLFFFLITSVIIFPDITFSREGTGGGGVWISGESRLFFVEKIDRNLLLFYMPDSFALSFPMAFGSPNIFYSLESENFSLVSPKNSMPPKLRLDFSSFFSDSLFQDTLEAFQNKRKLYLYDDSGKKEIVTNYCHGISVFMDSKLADSGFLVPQMSFDLFNTTVISCTITAFIMVNEEGIVSDVFVTESDAPRDLVNYAVQKLYRSTMQKNGGMISGNVLISWQR